MTTTEQTAKNIPLLSMNDARDPARRAEFVEALGKALEHFGFVALIDHGIDKAKLDRAYDVAVETFSLPEATKKRYEDAQGGRQRGYTAFGVEHAKDTDVPDLKEFWHVGPELAADDPLRVNGIMPANIFPSQDVPHFQGSFMDLFADLESFGLEVLNAVGEYLEVPADYFGEMTRGGNSVLRIINYPDMGRSVPAGAVRAAAHEDINLITILPSSTRPGLELMTREGEWMPISTPPNVMICDTGDMMQLLTAGRLPATTHRVVNPEESDGGRLSMPFFMHPRMDYLLEPLKEGFAEPVLTGDFLKQRLAEIGVS